MKQNIFFSKQQIDPYQSMDTNFQDPQGSLWQSWELNYPFFHPQCLTVPRLPLEGVICSRKAVWCASLLSWFTFFFPLFCPASLFLLPYRKENKETSRWHVIPLGKGSLLSAAWLRSREDEELRSLLGRLRGEKLSVGKTSQAVACVACSLGGLWKQIRLSASVTRCLPVLEQIGQTIS